MRVDIHWAAIAAGGGAIVQAVAAVAIWWLTRRLSKATTRYADLTEQIVAATNASVTHALGEDQRRRRERSEDAATELMTVIRNARDVLVNRTHETPRGRETLDFTCLTIDRNVTMLVDPQLRRTVKDIGRSLETIRKPPRMGDTDDASKMRQIAELHLTKTIERALSAINDLDLHRE